MDEELKRRFEALDVLRKAAWESFDKRRPFEWKVCIALWTALAVISGAILTDRAAIESTFVAGALSAMAGAIVILHGRWLIGLATAHYTDKEISIHFRDRMMELLGESFPNPLKSKLKAITDRWKHGWRLLFTWSHMFQIGVTLILSTAIAVAAWTSLAESKGASADGTPKECPT